MILAGIFSGGGVDSPALDKDLEAVGFGVTGEITLDTLVQDVIRGAPDVLVCYENHPDDALFAGIAALREAAPRPVIVFTSDPDVDKIERAAACGIHAYVVNGYGPHRLRSVIHVAQARFRHEQGLRGALSDIQSRFEERKLVDRAKGILMRARDISEEEAYRVLRGAAMQVKQRIGQTARQVIEATRYADAVNRAGQLRMLSQRLVKLYALMAADVTPGLTSSLYRDSIAHVETNLASLGRTLSKATFGDLIEAVVSPWSLLKAGLGSTPSIDRIDEIDRLAERLLIQAEALTKTLEAAGFVAALRVINISGRQRMLSQRMAKLAIMMALRGVISSDADELVKTRKAFVEGLAYLETIPLTTSEIRTLLDAARTAWNAFMIALPEERLGAIALLSETLLTQFDQLTDRYENTLQIVMA